ncbi:MAG TPA: sugar phosphate nucleotidyltransferase [Haliangiales bacterium]|nr:sugar phosphate nucleotidyltransferase [Haliangiales bacterium]
MPDRDEPIGLIPAAGRGTRLGLPYPKELQPLIRPGGFKPVAQLALEVLRRAGARHIVFVVNASKHLLLQHFGGGERFGVDISYVVQERVTEGVASPGLVDAIDAAHHLTRGRTVVFAMADTIVRPADALARMLAAAAPDDDLMMGLFPARRPEAMGMVEVEPSGRVVRVVDKPAKTDLHHGWGVLAWRPRFGEHLHERVRAGAGDLAAICNDAFARGLRGRGTIFADGRFADLGTYEDIVETERWYREEGGD